VPATEEATGLTARSVIAASPMRSEATPAVSLLASKSGAVEPTKENARLQQEEITSTSPEVETVYLSSELGQFEIEPLTSGFGLTLGNALRRVLLSSLTGAAITEIHLMDSQDDRGRAVVHEFSAVQGVREDTTELILNLKQVRLKSYVNETVYARLDVTGPGVVTAGDIQVSPDVEVVNTGLPIATLDNRGSHLDLRLTIEKGRGYLTAEGRESPSIGVIPIDAVFTPVRRVNYRVEKTRVGARTDYDKLLLEIQTDGTLGPKEALGQAARILIEQFQTFADLSIQPPPKGRDRISPHVPPSMTEMPIEFLELSSRTYNCLKRSQITTVGQLLLMSDDDLLALRNFGQKSLEELREKLAERGIRLTEEGALPRSGEEGEEEEERLGAWPGRPSGPPPIFEEVPEEEGQYEEDEEPLVRPRGHRARGYGRGRGGDDE